MFFSSMHLSIFISIYNWHPSDLLLPRSYHHIVADRIDRIDRQINSIAKKDNNNNCRFVVLNILIANQRSLTDHLSVDYASNI